MTDEVRACLGSLCSALDVKSIAAKDLPMVEAWTTLPRFSLPRFRFLVEETKRVRVKVNSVRYFDPIITEAFAEPVSTDNPSRPRALCERPWQEYLEYRSAMYGAPDAQTEEFWHARWEWERRALGLPIDERGNVPRETISAVSGKAE